MFEQLEESEEEKPEGPTNYTGLIIAAMLAPVFLLFVYMGKAEMGLAVFVILGMIVLAVGMRWNLRRHVWFWATIVFLLAIHAYLLFVVPLPQGWLHEIGRLHALGLLPIGIADLLLNLGVLGLAERLFSGDRPPDDDDE